MKVRRLLAGITVVLATLTLAACDSGPKAQQATGPTAVPTYTATPAPHSSSDLLRGRVLPFFAYQDSPESAFATDRATAIVKNACLARFGFPPVPVPAAPRAMPSMYRAFGVTDPAIAARYGYHLDPIGVTPERPTPQYSDALRLVLLGIAPGGEIPDPDNPAPRPTQTYQGKEVPPFGCQGEAVKAVEPPGLTGEELTLAQRLGGESWSRTMTDPRMRKATASFEACMTAKGYRGGYDDPLAPMDDFDVDGPLTAKEVATTVADVDCKRDTKLIDAWFAIESEYENAAIQKNIETLNKVNTARDAAVANALKIAGNGG